MSEKPHKDNVPGPFYVTDGCCTSCDVPFVEAPGMFAYDDQSHCFVKRQPKSPDDLTRMLRAVHGSEVECIRYRGREKDVLRRMAEGGMGNLSDTAVPNIKPISRDHVTFDSVISKDKLLLDMDLATEFRRYLRGQESEYVKHKFTPNRSDGEKTSFSYSWYEDNFHPVEFSFIGESERRWLVVTDVSLVIHDWLVAEDRFCDIRWYTEEHWKTSKEWQETPL